MRPSNASTRIIRAKAPYSRYLYMHVAWLLATTSLLQSGVASAAPPAGPVLGKSHKSAIVSQVPAIADALRLRASSVEEEISVHDAQTALLYDNATTISSEKSTGNHLKASPSTPIKEPGIWPCMDELDKKLIKISLPVIASFAVPPVVQALDLIFINRLGNALAVAGQAAANQMYGSIFWLTSFIPSITAIQVSKQVAQGNQDGAQEAVCRAIVVGVLFASIGSAGMLLYPERALGSVMKSESLPGEKSTTTLFGGCRRVLTCFCRSINRGCSCISICQTIFKNTVSVFPTFGHFYRWLFSLPR